MRLTRTSTRPRRAKQKTSKTGSYGRSSAPRAIVPSIKLLVALRCVALVGLGVAPLLYQGSCQMPAKTRARATPRYPDPPVNQPWPVKNHAVKFQRPIPCRAWVPSPWIPATGPAHEAHATHQTWHPTRTRTRCLYNHGAAQEKRGYGYAQSRAGGGAHNMYSLRRILDAT